MGCLAQDNAQNLAQNPAQKVPKTVPKMTPKVICHQQQPLQNLAQNHAVYFWAEVFFSGRQTTTFGQHFRAGSRQFWAMRVAVDPGQFLGAHKWIWEGSRTIRVALGRSGCLLESSEVALGGPWEELWGIQGARGV